MHVVHYIPYNRIVLIKYTFVVEITILHAVLRNHKPIEYETIRFVILYSLHRRFGASFFLFFAYSSEMVPLTSEQVNS